MIHDVRTEYEAVYMGWRETLADSISDAQALFERSPKAVWAAWEKAWQAKNISQVVTLGTVLRRNGHIDAVQIRLAFALVGDGLYEEALDVLTPPAPSVAKQSGYWVLLARAQAGVGNFKEGRATAMKALELEPPYPRARPLSKTLKSISKRANEARSAPTWPAFLSWISGCIEFGARSAGALAVRTALKNPPAMEPDSLPAAIAVARAGISLVGPKKLEPLVRQIFLKFPDDDSALALMLDCDAELGFQRAERRSRRLALREGLPALLRDAEASFERDGDGLLATWERTSNSADISRRLALATVLHRHGRLTVEARERLGATLVAEGLYEEAVELLAPPPEPDPQTPEYFVLLATALGALSRFEAGQDAAERAVELQPDLAAASALVKTLKRVRRSSADAQAAPAWPAFQGWIEGCIALDARAEGIEAVHSLLKDPPPMDPGSENAVFAVARAAMSLLGPDESAPLIERIGQAFPDSEQLPGLKREHEGRLGHMSSHPLAGSPKTQADIDLRIALAGQLVLRDPHAAITTLAPVAQQNEKDIPLMASLAHLVGQQVLSQVRPEFVAGGRRKIFNLSPFYNEYLLTKMRLHEMSKWVDYFIFVEAGQTYMGVDKEFNFEKLKDELQEFSSKILYVKVDKIPDYLNSAWAREFYQRDMAVSALNGICGPDDLVLLTDADELVEERAVTYFNGSISSLRMKVNKFFLNYQPDKGNKYAYHRAGALCRADLLQKYGSSYIRFYLSGYRKDWHVIPQAGWHFTSINAPELISQKFRNYSHQGQSKEIWRNQGRVAEFLDRLRAGDLEEGWTRAEIDGGLPAYISQHREELKDFLL